MRKKTIAILYIISIVLALIGVGFIIGGLAGSTYTTTSTGYSTSTHVQQIGNPPLFIIGVVLAALAGIPHLVAWIGALVALARLQQWVWFILMILFSSLCLLVYLIAGPDISRRIPQYAPNADLPPQYPPQYAPNPNLPPPPQYPS